MPLKNILKLLLSIAFFAPDVCPPIPAAAPDLLEICSAPRSNVFAQSKPRRKTRRKPRASGQARRKPLQQNKPPENAGVGFVATPPETVAEMLRIARIKPDDVLYDLGSGDGRIPIAAALNYGVRAVGVEVEPDLIKQADESARAAGVGDKVKFVRADLFRVNLRRATVVTLYLSDEINERLLPKLLRELPPGARIVSHDFLMGDWKPEKSIKVPWTAGLYRNVHLWTVPERRAHRRRKLSR